MSQALIPGNYFIELAFKRPVDETVLTRALTAIGFTNIEFDKNEDAATIGALSLGGASGRAAPATARPTLGMVRMAPVVVATKSAMAARAPTTTRAPYRAPAASAPPSKGITMPSSPSTPTIPKPADIMPAFPGGPWFTWEWRVPSVWEFAKDAGKYAPGKYYWFVKGMTGSPPKAQAASPSLKSRLIQTSVSLSKASPALAPPPSSKIARPGLGLGSASMGPASPGGGGGGEASATEAYVPDQTMPQDGGYDASTNNFQPRPAEPEEQQAPAAEPEPELQAAPADEPEASTLGTSVKLMQVMKLPVVDRWKRWVEWGSPFATTPGHLVSVSGEDDNTISRVRFVATLNRTLVPQNLRDMSWMFIRRLAIDPFADLNFQLVPFSLRREGFYEFRFFSRLKSNPTKDDVKKAMADMGFSPMKLNMLKKNMRIPHRARVSVSMWLGIGKWSAPNSVVTSEDPFFFESMREVQP